MKFLADQDVWAATTMFLRGLGHDVVTTSELGLAQADDVDLLATAHQQGRIFVTRDRDYGGLVFVDGNAPGVIYLRVLPTTRDAVHSELARVLSLYPESDLHAAFIVVEPSRHRIRRPPPAQGP
jgi:predicted nuclease of predicted toxin-antitoxin system